MTSPAAGWYPDPAGSGGQRYWNGMGWTDHVTGTLPASRGADASQEPTSADSADPNSGADRGRAAWPDLPGAPQPNPERPPSDLPAEDQTVPQTPVGSTEAPMWPPVAQPSAVPPNPNTGWPATRPGPIAGAAGSAPGLVLGPDGQVLAGWWRRAFGLILDNVLIGFLTLMFVVLYGAVTGAFDDLIDQAAFDDLLAKLEADPNYQPSLEEFTAFLGPGWGTLLLLSIGCSLILGFINGVLLVSSSGQTVGDRVVKLRKVIVGRRPPSFGAATLRWIIPNGLNVLGNLPLVGLFAIVALLTNYLWPLWDAQNQTWQDKAARTHVERADLAGPLALTQRTDGVDGYGR